MHAAKKIFIALTGYWIHKKSTLPVGVDLFVDLQNRINYPSLETIFDVGANIGQTWEWLRRNNSRSKIYCFEPVKQTCESLRRRTGYDKNCIVENLAFGNIVGSKTIKLFDSLQSDLNSLKNEAMNNANHAVGETIQIETIDNYCIGKGIKHIDLLKIDTEGYELQVLQGAEKYLKAANISFIYCEVGFLKNNLRNTNFSELTEWLAPRDYFFFGLYKIACNAWKEGDYFGNALYVHKELF